MAFVKVHFELEIIEDGFPPISVETLNATLVRGNTLKLDNTPFFATSVAIGDILNCKKNENSGKYQFINVIEESGKKAISIIFIDSDCEEDIFQYFKSKGCFCEYGEFKDFNMLAVCIDETLDYNTLTPYLDEKQEAGLISYAELCL